MRYIRHYSTYMIQPPRFNALESLCMCQTTSISIMICLYYSYATTEQDGGQSSSARCGKTYCAYQTWISSLCYGPIQLCDLSFTTHLGVGLRCWKVPSKLINNDSLFVPSIICQSDCRTQNDFSEKKKTIIKCLQFILWILLWSQQLCWQIWALLTSASGSQTIE